MLDDACSHYTGLETAAQSVVGDDAAQSTGIEVPRAESLQQRGESVMGSVASERGEFESGFSKLMLLLDKHKRVATEGYGSAASSVRPMSALGGDAADGDDEGLSIVTTAEPDFAKVTSAWLTSPEALGIGVTWDARLLKLFKPLCVSRVAAAHRTREVRRRLKSRGLTAAQQALKGSSPASRGHSRESSKSKGDGGLVCASLAPPEEAQYYDEECTFEPEICPNSIKIAEAARVRAF